MKKLALTIATVATLAAVATAPAEARGGRVRAGVAAVTVATAAAIAADAYFNGSAMAIITVPRRWFMVTVPRCMSAAIAAGALTDGFKWPGGNPGHSHVCCVFDPGAAGV